MTQQTHSETPPRRKATLFCWECDHASPVDGDWIRNTSGDTVAYVCPRCETTIDERPQHEDPHWRRALRHSLNAWRATVTVSSRTRSSSD